MRPGEVNDYMLLSYINQNGQEAFVPPMIEYFEAEDHETDFYSQFFELIGSGYIEMTDTKDSFIGQGYAITLKGLKYLAQLQKVQDEQQQEKQKTKEKGDIDLILAKQQKELNSQQTQLNNFLLKTQQQDYKLKILNIWLIILGIIVAIVVPVLVLLLEKVFK